jgi:hypothetical protein
VESAGWEKECKRKKTENIIAGPGRKVLSHGGISVVHGFAIGQNNPAVWADVYAHEFRNDSIV